jgi:hypothetical protein
VSGRVFPILSARPGDPCSIPWAMLAPHEAQAIQNHDQDLAKLASRGGLGVAEAVAVLEGRSLREVRGMGDADAVARLTALVDAWLVRNSTIGREAAAIRTREIVAMLRDPNVIGDGRLNWEGYAEECADLIRARYPKAFVDPTPIGRTWTGRDGSVNCDECCNGDRCDDASHRDRRNCKFCGGTGVVTPTPRG